MKALDKIRGLPEGKRKLIFWITAAGIGILMVIWFVVSAYARIRTITV